MNSKMVKSMIIIFLSCNLYAQNLRLDYQLTYKEDSLSSETVDKNMVLLIQGDKSKFLTEKQYKVDSLRSKGFEDFAVGDNSFLVVNYPENLAFKYYFIFRDVYKVKEVVNQNWEIRPETRKIGNYLCTKAVLNYKDRIWEAWFTQDIPVRAGPYVFQNLPGLIVDMEDSTGSYKFSLYSVRKRSEILDFENMFKGVLSIPQRRVNKAFLDYYNDPFREIKSAKNKPKFKDENGKDIEPDFRKMTTTAQSRLKKNNNPIDLSDAVKYPD